ncbi:MAG: cell division protein [Massilia sp.]|jgi:cell division protein FtsN|nr:cell division protein [Massilia sp.]MDB5948493.1 cell division protein [Massilia sp.]
MHLTSRRPLRPFLRQQGNTLTGMIIGLIVGLAIAVAVALAITKGATPFTDKAAKPGKLEPTAGQASDPNKPLYGSREAAREANKHFADKPNPPAAAAPAPAHAAARDADPLAAVIANMKEPADVKPEVKKRVAPAVALAAPAAPAAEAAAAHELARVATPKADTGGDDKVIYFLQAGAFREMSDAEATRAKLALLGFEATVSDRISDAGTLHRVRIGPYSQVEAMTRARAKLVDSGIDVAIVRNQR